MHFLFPDFLEKEASYEACVRFWLDLITEVEQSLGQSGEWPSWIPRTYTDGGKPMDLDGNPIIDGFSQSIGRAYRVIQQPPEGDARGWLGAFVERRDDPIYEGTGFPPVELTIALTLTDETAEVARALLRTWMDPNQSIAETERAISSLNADPKSR